MSIVQELMNYEVELEWLLTWYPVKSTSSLTHPIVRGATLRHSLADLPQNPGTISSVGHTLGKGNARDGDDSDPLLQQTGVLLEAQVLFGVNESEVFTVDLSVFLGQQRPSNEDLILPPDTRTPFMINVRADKDEEDPGLKDTALVLQGVFTTSHRASERLAELMAPLVQVYKH